MNSEESPRTGLAGDTLLIRGKKIPVSTMEIPHAELRFYPENPRVYSLLRSDGRVPTQDEIQEQLLEMEHVKELIQDIRLNGGLIEPLIVKDLTFEVLEGNSRLAAYRHLARTDPLRWSHVKCTVLPRDIEEALVFALLGQVHIKGKKDWVPFEQAGFLYRRYKNHHTEIKTLALEVGISTKLASHLVETYEFMVDHGEENIKRWSYYDEYLKSNKIKKARKRYSEMDSIVIEKIHSGEIERAMDLRDRLPVICSSQKALKKLVAGGLDFQEAYEASVESGADTSGLKTIKKFREWVTAPSVEERLLDYQGKIRASAIYELKKIELKARTIVKKLETR